jgi:cell division protein FtsB
MPVGTKTYVKKILLIRAGILVTVIASLFLVVSVYERFTIEREMAARRDAVEAEAAALEARKGELQREVEYLSREESVEAEIRKHFDVAREGEQVVIIMDNTPTTTEPIVPVAPPPAPWYQFWR